jgi:large subunit ribosomal protein L7/L12
MDKNYDLIGDIAETISGLTTIDARKFLLKIEDAVGVEVIDAALVMAEAIAKGEAVPISEERTYDLWLGRIGPNKARTIKVVKLLSGLSLNEAKNLVDRAPVVLKKGVSKQEAEQFFDVFWSHNIELYTVPWCV